MLTSRTTKYPNGVEVTENFEDEVTEPVTAPASDPHTVSFFYHGEARTVQNPQIIRGAFNRHADDYNTLLGGVELESGQYKNFLLSEIEYA